MAPPQPATNPPAAASPTVSFELMPPRNPAKAPNFWRTAGELVGWGPDFISVTYGAAGSGADHNTSRAVIAELLADTHTWPLAHLTCVGTTQDAVKGEIEAFLSTGTRAFLALRGDPPADTPNWEPPADGVASAIDLVHLIKRVDRSRNSTDAATALRSAIHPLAIGVATFPDGNHVARTTPAQEAERLAAKQRAGAAFAITQLFYEADVYLEFRELAARHGVTIPILAGLLPATAPHRLRKLAGLTGMAAPSSLLRELDAAADNHHRQLEVGVRFTAALLDDLLAGGAPGVHLYTFNQAGPALAVLAAATAPGIRARHPLAA